MNHSAKTSDDHGTWPVVDDVPFPALPLAPPRPPQPPLLHSLHVHTNDSNAVENLLANQRAVVIGVVHRHGVVGAVVVVLDVEVGERQTHRVIGGDRDEPRAVDAVRVDVRIAR